MSPTGEETTSRVGHFWVLFIFSIFIYIYLIPEKQVESRREKKEHFNF